MLDHIFNNVMFMFMCIRYRTRLFTQTLKMYKKISKKKTQRVVKHLGFY